jgi:hypothetical protein
MYLLTSYLSVTNHPNTKRNVARDSDSVVQ